MNSPASSFTAKQLRATITLATPNAMFPGTNSNTLVLTGLRMMAIITAVARSAVTADIKIFGMLQADMNALTVIWFNPPVVQNNTILLEANVGNGWVQVFSGTLFEAQADYTAQPNVFFRFQANQSFATQITAVPPASYTGAASVATIVQALATQMGLAFENNGVTATLHNPYFPGTAFDQLQRVCWASDTDFYIVGAPAGSSAQGTLAICPSGLGRNSVAATVLSPTSGLVGYPAIGYSGLTVQCLYNPNIIGGGQIQIQGSQIPAANGLWNPLSFTHTLDAVNPGGAWMTTLTCIKYGTPLPDLTQ